MRAALRKPAQRKDGLFSSYGTIGAVCESSRWLARRMELALGGTSLPIVELGAGYGSVTSVLPDSAISIERDAKRYDYLKGAFPNRTIIDTCAIAFMAGLEKATVVVSSIPSINNSEFPRLRASVARAVKNGTVTQLITYTYFPHNPFDGIFPNAERLGLELLNVPPAFVWRYSC